MSRAKDMPPALPWWWLAIRLRTLSLAVVPVLAGSMLAWAQGAAAAWLPLSAALTCALAIQVGTNLFNDVGDAARGNDGPERLGPPRVTASGLASPAQVGRAAGASFAVALALGTYLVWFGGWPILLIGLVSLLAGWAYSNGPKPLSHTPWGEVLVIAFFGVIAVLGSHYLQSGRFSTAALVGGLALGLPAAAVLLVNNVRDLDADRRVGRLTLAAVLGPRRSRWLYLALMLAPFPLLALLPVPLAALSALPALPLFAWLGWRFLHRPGGVGLNAQLAQTAQAQLVLGALLCVGLGLVGRS